MAISGSGGWFPSQAYSLNWRGELERVGYTQNRPRESVLSVEEAATKLLNEPDAIVAIDVRDGNPAKLTGLIEDGKFR